MNTCMKRLNLFIASLLFVFGISLSATANAAAPVTANPVSNTANQVAFGWWWGCQPNHYRDATYWTEWRTFNDGRGVHCQKSCLVREWDGSVVRCIKRCR